jgi:hypothetical protein
MLLETTKIIIGKVGWSAVFERFYTRLVIYGLNKIKSMTTNDVIDDTVQDIINQLKGKRLKVVDENKG